MGKKLYVGNLSYETTEEKLRTLFSEFGEVQSVNLITDRESGRPRGFAFVEMADDQAATAAAAALTGKTVDNRAINVAEARPQADRGGGDRRGGGGGGDRRGGGGGDRQRSRW
jgi:cold-inducible RNA-binding protein